MAPGHLSTPASAAVPGIDMDNAQTRALIEGSQYPRPVVAMSVRVYPKFRGLSSRHGVQEAEVTQNQGKLPTVTHNRIQSSNRPFLTSAESQPGVAEVLSLSC